jgi:hypothetical protein
MCITNKAMHGAVHAVYSMKFFFTVQMRLKAVRTIKNSHTTTSQNRRIRPNHTPFILIIQCDVEYRYSIMPSPDMRQSIHISTSKNRAREPHCELRSGRCVIWFQKSVLKKEAVRTCGWYAQATCTLHFALGRRRGLWE